MHPLWPGDETSLSKPIFSWQRILVCLAVTGGLVVLISLGTLTLRMFVAP